MYRTLVWHFFERFFDKESLSADSEPQANVVQTLALLTIPGAFFVLVLRPLTLEGWDLEMARYFFVSLSMLVMGFVMVFEWNALFLDARDYQVLTPLPVGLGQLFAAKVAALGLFLSLFLVDINFFATLLWNGVDTSPDWIAVLAGHIVALLAAGLFTALACAALQGVLITLLPARVFQRVSVLLQTALMAVFVMLVLLTPVLGGMARGLVAHASPIARWLPPFWFLGLYERLRPAVRSPLLLELGGTGARALMLAAAAFVLTYLPLYRRHARKIIEAPAPNPAGPGPLAAALSRAVDRLLLPNPVERGVFHYISQTITRSVKHRLFLASYAGFGAALALISLRASAEGLLALPLSLSFVLLSALRAAFNFPAELRANWAFQLSEDHSAAECVAATRKWIAVCGIAPLFLLLLPVELLHFSWTAALFHAAYGVTLAALLLEVLFVGFRKVPFTCAYFPGKINLVGLTALYIWGFTTYSGTMARLEAWLWGEPWAAALFFASAAAAWLGAAARRRRGTAALALDYENPGDPVVRTLDLTVS